MARFLVLTIFAATIFASSAAAQVFPQRESSGVNDYATMIDDKTEMRMSQTLEKIYDDHGVEISIVTLSSIRFYTEDTSIEDYATDLFNAWEIGDEDEDDGILMLIFRDDREIRIELGTGFDRDAAQKVSRVIDQDIVPLFRNNEFPGGIEAGIDGLLSRVIDPDDVNAPSQTSVGSEQGSGNTLYYILGGVVAAILGLIGLNKRRAAKFAKKPCASCGKPGLQKTREVLKEATLEEEGHGENRIHCPSCGHVETKTFKISKRRPKGPQGGGGAKGEGATGKW